MKLLLALAFALLAGSPELPVISDAGIIVRHVYRDTRCDEFHYLDPLFVCPTRAQFAEMATFCAANRTREYETNLFDCEDLAREFRVFAARWALKKYPGLPAGIAVGQAVVRIQGHVDGLGEYSNDSVLHAMIVVVLADGRTVLLEPRNSRYIFPLSAVYEGCVEFISIDF